MDTELTAGDTPPDSLPLIVGIGAAAGGCDALVSFLAPLTSQFGFALVFIQHLSPRHENLLPGLIRSRRPDIEITEISGRLAVLPGRLYLCPPGMDLQVQKGIFLLVPPPEGAPRLPIDDFFVSLAAEAGDRAIAVICSGEGADGALGIQAVRRAGGVVFVQDPATAESAGMPLAAISTGQADAVLSPEDIAREILKIRESGTVVSRPGDISITPAQFETFFRTLQKKTGARFHDYKKNVVARRIKRRMYLRGIFSLKEYAQMIADDDAEAAALAADLMIGVTAFFRDRVAWRALRIEVVSKIAAEDALSPLRIWTPACATGEESYSIAMMLHHELALAGKKREIQVFATDVNDHALERARAGKYPRSIAADVPPEFMRNFFTPAEDGLFVIVNKEIREYVVFAKQDLLTDPPFSRLDAIICRNLLIYLDPDAQEKCISLFHYALKDGGYLFLGNAESVGGKYQLFKTLGHKQCRIYRKLEAKPSQRLPLAVPFAAERAASFPARQSAAAAQQQSVTGTVQETLLDEYGPAAIAIDQHGDIIYHTGPTNRYLQPPRGIPTQNLLDLLPEKLRSRVRGGLYRAGHAAKAISLRTGMAGLGLADNEGERQVTLRISKLREDLFLIVFQEKNGLPEPAVDLAPEAAAGEETAVRQLESELSATRQDLQNHIEQLKSLNEELQSSNEELQAANEELETSREELQSLNEELITVNAQLQNNIEEQDATNNDLNNFLASTSIPTLFLDHQLKVKRFTPAMSKFISLIPADLGRPIDMFQEHLGPELIADARAVLDRLAPVRKEMMIHDAWYVRTTLPYRTSDNRIEGVVLTYTDVTELKCAEASTRHLASFPQLNPNPVLEAGPSGKITFLNPATQKILDSLGMDRKQAAAFLPADLDDMLRDWDRVNEASFHREITVKDRVFEEAVYLSPQFNDARIYARDITKRKRMDEAILHAKEEWERTFDSVPDLIAIIDNNHRVRRVNQAMAQRLGLPVEQCVGLPCHQSVHGLSAPHDLCPHTRTLADGAQHIAEFHEERLGGDFLVSTTPLYDAGGTMVGSVHVARDITERKQAEEFAKALITIGNMIHSTLDFDEIMKLALAEASRALLCERAVASLRRQDLWVVNCSHGFPEEIVGSVMSDEQEPHAVLAITTKQPVAINDAYADDRVNLDHMKRYGVRAVLVAPLLIEDEAAGVLFFNYHKSPVAFSRIQIDFTRQLGLSLSLALQNSRLFQNQRRAEQSLQKANRRLAVLSETAGALLASDRPQELVNELCRKVMEYLDCHAFFYFLVDERAGRLRLNACAGIPAEEARRIEWLDYGIAVCGCAARDNCRIVAEHIPTTPDERTVLVKSYGIKAYACHPLLGSGGKVIGTLSFGTRNRETFSEEDLSLMKAVADQVAVAISRMGTELALRQRGEELQAANRDLEAFIYSVSHDLRTPMRSMAVFTKMIADGYADRLDDKGRDYFRRVRDAGVRMNRLVEDLLYLSRVSRQEIKRKTFDLSGMASHLVAELRESSPGRNVEVNIEKDISVFADPQLIELVLANLLGNAWKFTSKTDKARISFGGREEEGALAYCVSDNGAGFDPEYAGKMFHPFQRLHSDEEFEGTGIGLAIVEQAIRRHGGKVWAEGNIGKGATIFFTLADPGKC